MVSQSHYKLAHDYLKVSKAEKYIERLHLKKSRSFDILRGVLNSVFYWELLLPCIHSFVLTFPLFSGSIRDR